MATVSYTRLLRTNGRFRDLWAGQVVSELGNWFNFIAELGLARALSGSALAASLIVAAHWFPFCVLAPFAGAIADRFPRRTMMVLADLSRAAVALGFMAVTTPDRLWIAYVCAAAISSLSAFFDAAKNAAMPNLARGPELLPATSLIHATRFLQMTVGALAGAMVSEAVGYRAAFAINAVSFVVSALFVLRIPAAALEPGPVARAAARPASARALLADLGDAFAFIRSTPLVLAITTLNVAWALGGGMTQVINDRFGGIVFAGPGRAGDTGVAVLTGAAGVGLAVGMLVARRVGDWVGSRDRVGTFIGWMIVASGAIYAAGGAMPSLWLMAAMFAASRVVLSAEYAVQDTVLLVAIPDGLRGKVYIIDRALELGTLSFAAIVAGGLFAVMPPRAVPVVAGLLMSAPGAVWLVALARGRFRVPRHALGA
jgi:MFS family permease